MTGVRLIVLFCFVQVAGMAGFASFPALLPGFFDVWGLTSTQAGWINGIYFGAYMISVLPLLSLTDRLDPKRIYLLGALLTALSSLAFAFLAEGFWGALVFRALAGIGLAGTYMTGLKALTDRLPGQLSTRAVAFYTATFSIGAALSFLLAGPLDAALGWRWAFGLTAMGPLAAFLLVLFLVPGSAVPERPDTALLDFRPVLKNRRAMGYVIAYSAHNWELFALRTWLVAFLAYSQSLQPADAPGGTWSTTTLAALITLLGLPASVLGNEASHRFGRRRVVIAIMSLSALIAAFIGFGGGLPFVLLVGLCFLYGITVTADSSSITAGAVANAKPNQRGATMAVHSFIGFAGAFTGPVAFGVVLDLAGGGKSLLAWGLAFASAGLAVAVGPLVLTLIGQRGEEERE
jgi:MFS family permease